ncbi:hypothetical protein ACHAXT_010250 [Thalassiosira profunda]
MMFALLSRRATGSLHRRTAFVSSFVTHPTNAYCDAALSCRSPFSASPRSLSIAPGDTSSQWERISNHQTSKTVKLFKAVHRANKAKRLDLGLTVAEGVRLVSDILADEQSRNLVRRIVVSESLLSDEKNADEYQEKLQSLLEMVDQESRERKQHYANSGAGGGDAKICSINVGTDKVVEACSGTVTSQGVVALMTIPPQFDPVTSIANSSNQEVKMPPFYLVLDGLSDPGNVGTLLRTCAASHVTALILLPGSCDVWNPKAVRSAMGASFRVPVLEMGRSGEREALEEVLDLLERGGVDRRRVFAATMESSGDNESVAHYAVDFTQKSGAAVILGREGEGLRPDVLDVVRNGEISTVFVPMAPGTESLNAAVCGSVIMFERMRQLLQANENDSREE